MKHMEFIITEHGAKLLAESKFKPFVPSQRRENNKKELTEMFKKNMSPITVNKEMVRK